MNTILSLPHISPLGFCLTPNTFQSNDSAEGNFKQLELQQTANSLPYVWLLLSKLFSQEAAIAYQKGKYGVLQPGSCCCMSEG